MRTETSEMLPKTLPGTVCVQWTRCNRPNCHCARGTLHGPYYCRFWRENGRLRKKYVKRSDLEKVRTQCNARRALRQQVKDSWVQIRKLRELVRKAEPE